MSLQRKAPPLVILVGPTAVGKTAIAIELALRLQGEVVTADSMQVYRGMDIGTAKPTIAERRGVPHHMIDLVTPDQSFNVARYRDLAHRVIADIYERGRLPIVSGGTGLYVRALLEEFQLPAPGAAPEIRSRLEAEAERLGKAALHERLATLDPPTAARLHPNDVRRVIRALEVLEVTGKPLSQHLAEAEARPPRYQPISVGLTRPRDELYRRIDRRVDLLMDAGLLEEVRSLTEQYTLNRTARQGLGYKEMIAYLEGECTFDEAIERLKRETRRYAKRQLTWFRRDRHVRWFDLSSYPSEASAIDAIEAHITAHL